LERQIKSAGIRRKEKKKARIAFGGMKKTKKPNDIRENGQSLKPKEGRRK
jgi:hypothetical protein